MKYLSKQAVLSVLLTAALPALYSCESDDESEESKEEATVAGPVAGNGGAVNSQSAQEEICSYETSWTSIDDFQLENLYTSIPRYMAQGQSDEIYVLGYAYTSGQPGAYSVLRKLESGASSFTTEDQHSYASANNTLPFGLAVTLSGTPFIGVREYHGTSGGDPRVRIRAPTGDDDAWENQQDQYFFEDGQDMYPNNLATLANGTVVATGYGYVASPSFNLLPIYYSSSDGGTTWANDSDLEFGDESDVIYDRPHSLSEFDDELWIVGNGFPTDCGGNAGYVARSTNGGTSWSVLDEYCVDADESRSVTVEGKLLRDNRNNFYYVGYYWDGEDNVGFVRRSADNGSSWNTVLTYQYDGDHSAYIYSIVQGGDGVIYAGGVSYDASQGYSTIHSSSDNGDTWSVATESGDAGSAGTYFLMVDRAKNLWQAMYRSDGAGFEWHARRKTCNLTAEAD